MADVVMYGSTAASPDLFHAIPVTIVDPFLYVETNGRKVATVSVLDASRVQAVAPDVEILDVEPFGRRQLLHDGVPRARADRVLARRVLVDLGVRAARVPADFPLALADHLREAGIELIPDDDLFVQRRRIKNERELAGIRRAQTAADAAMATARDRIHACPDGLTCERVRAEMRDVARAHGCELAEEVVVAPNEQGAVGHEAGTGPIRPGDVVIVDIWPHDPASRCWADMTRTFVAGAGEPSAEIREFFELTREALARCTEAVRPGVTGAELNDIASEVYEAAGQPTARSAEGALRDGFFHGLGHGLGLDVHEAPALGIGGEALVAGDVITIEPGCYRQGFGGVRLEDLVLVTAAGCEVLTDFPYEL